MIATLLAIIAFGLTLAHGGGFGYAVGSAVATYIVVTIGMTIIGWVLMLAAAIVVGIGSAISRLFSR